MTHAIRIESRLDGSFLYWWNVFDQDGKTRRRDATEFESAEKAAEECGRINAREGNRDILAIPVSF